MFETTYTSAKLHKIAQGWPEFRAFVQETDALAGREIIDNAFRHMFSPRGKAKVKKKKAEMRELTATLVGALLQETMKAIDNKNSIDDLYRRAINADLRQGLTNPGNGEFPWTGHNPTTQNEDIEIALNWILGRSTTNKAKEADYDYFEATAEEIERAEEVARQNVVQTLRNGLTNVIRNGNMDITDVNTLHYLHRHSGPTNAVRRWFGTAGLAEQFYGGTALGGALHRYVGGKVQNMVALTRFNRFFWYDIACLQLTGNIIAHGFADGNGRASRAIFACTQIQKGLPFVAPLYRWTTNQVTGQNVNQVIHPNQQALDAYTDQLVDALV
ncbi:MAG: hypothetical protein ACFB03_14635 [Paracoccaceae bacterium]